MGASPRFGSRSAQPGGGVSMLHLLGYLILLVTGFQAGRMACSWGELGGDVSMDSPATQRAILSRINRLERLAEAAALANPALATAAGLARTDDPAERDARRLRKLAATPAGSGGVPHGRCRDKLEKCADWAAAGECKRNGAYMRETCPKSCDFCAVASGSGGSAAAGGGGGAGSGETGPDGCPANRRPFHGESAWSQSAVVVGGRACCMAMAAWLRRAALCCDALCCAVLPRPAPSAPPPARSPLPRGASCCGGARARRSTRPTALSRRRPLRPQSSRRPTHRRTSSGRAV